MKRRGRFRGASLNLSRWPEGGVRVCSACPAPQHGLEIGDIEAILKASGRPPSKDLKVVRRDRAQPISMVNALVLTVTEARRRRGL